MILWLKWLFGFLGTPADPARVYIARRPMFTNRNAWIIVEESNRRWTQWRLMSDSEKDTATGPVVRQPSNVTDTPTFNYIYKERAGVRYWPRHPSGKVPPLPPAPPQCPPSRI